MHPQLLVHVRHGQSIGNLLDEDGRAKLSMSTSDYPLTELGHEQARLTGDYLRQRFGIFDVAFTSHYTRARETLASLNINAKEMVIEPLLAESNRGIWHIMPHDEMGQKYPDEVRRKKLEGLYHHRAIGGENNADVEMRIALFQHRLAHEYAGKKVLVIVHGTWQLLFERRFYNQTPEKFIERYHQKDIMANAAINIYEARPAYGFIGPRRHLKHREYLIPWQGKIALPKKEELA